MNSDERGMCWTRCWTRCWTCHRCSRCSGHLAGCWWKPSNSLLVSRCIEMYRDVSRCIEMYRDVSRCIEMYRVAQTKNYEELFGELETMSICHQAAIKLPSCCHQPSYASVSTGCRGDGETQKRLRASISGQRHCQALET